MADRPPVYILVAPESASRLAAIEAGQSPRLDYRVVAEYCHGTVVEGTPSPATLPGAKASRVARSLGPNLHLSARLLGNAPDGSAFYATGETWGVPLALAGALWSRRRFPHIIYVHRVFSPNWLRFLKACRRLLRIDGYICVTERQAALLRETLGPDGPAVTVISQGVDTSFFDPIKACTSTIPPYILAVGAEMRNYELLFEAVRDLPVNVIVKASSAWMTAGRNGLRSIPANVKLISSYLSYPELRDLYAGAQLVVAPLYDTFQAAGITTILEGLAMGKCVVATQTSGLPDALIHGHTGLVAPPTADGLQQAIQLAWHDSKLRSALAAAGQTLVRSDYTLEQHARAVVATLEKLSTTRATQSD